MAPRRRRLIKSSSPSPISKLGDDDLLVEVLSRLPNTRSVWRCKSVCKRWKSLISAPYFSRRFVSHRRAGEEPPLLIPSGVWGPIWSFLPVPKENPFGAIVADCFRDLLLLKFADWSGKNHDELRRSYLVCNPFTQQWVALPLAPKRSITLTARLVCEPSKSKIPDKFCVVIMYYHPKLDVFCSKSGNWISVALHGSIPSWSIKCLSAVSLNGKLYWKSCEGGVAIVGWSPFGRNDEDRHHHRIPFPPVGANDEDVSLAASVWVSQGALHLVSREGMRDGDDDLSVWRLEESTGRWERRYVVSLKKLIRDSFELKGSQSDGYIVVGLHLEKSEIVFLRSFIHGECGLISCDLRNEVMEVFAYRRGRVQDDYVLQPRVALWPTRVPNYEKLRGSYDGSFSCWVQPSKLSNS